jgi:hypothetical protein
LIDSTNISYPSRVNKSLSLVLKPGSNVIEFDPQYESKTIGADPRLFSFSISNYSF